MLHYFSQLHGGWREVHRRQCSPTGLRKKENDLDCSTLHYFKKKFPWGIRSFLLVHSYCKVKHIKVSLSLLIVLGIVSLYRDASSSMWPRYNYREMKKFMIVDDTLLAQLTGIAIIGIQLSFPR